MSPHNCPGLLSCSSHPRVHVWRSTLHNCWYITSPGSDLRTLSTEVTFADAIAEAHRLARARGLSAVESQPGVTV